MLSTTFGFNSTHTPDVQDEPLSIQNMVMHSPAPRILGSNGAGKSSLLKIMAGVETVFPINVKLHPSIGQEMNPQDTQGKYFLRRSSKDLANRLEGERLDTFIRNPNSTQTKL